MLLYKLEFDEVLREMNNDRFNLLANQFSAYRMTFSKDGALVEIINPFGGENIRVEYFPDDDFTPYIVYFAFQHCHMCDEEDVADYIMEIIDGNLFSIEFFNQGTRCFGGDISAEEWHDSSYECLSKCMEKWGIAKLLDYADSFKLRGWYSEHNFDAVFDVDEKGKPTIKKVG